ncbi:hypothetical protein PF010_g33309 [Phytophthora fragariae]|uniref:Secreted protein n=1 Tax=Phytophthora fragariae TaxID=53985 RepID=A0A6A3G2P7_9STRA|nr:hypothetical protein PF011_g32607 [Phytophthora fragariae]KAE9039593.1 hypothetical protein PF010_g33309 [Phytophthora fragariae]KAE9226113.1 hypothetical protein PF002_g14209 [Phytophthora fragariae]
MMLAWAMGWLCFSASTDRLGSSTLFFTDFRHGKTSCVMFPRGTPSTPQTASCCWRSM